MVESERHTVWFQKIWKADGNGSFIDGIQSSAVTVDDLSANTHDSYAVRLGTKPHAQNQGGLNLFGSRFGNYQQDIVLRIDFA